MASGNMPGDSNAAQVRVPCIIFFVLTPIFLALRIGNRIWRRTGLGWDDWTILLSFLCTLVVQVLMLTSCHYGFGKHIYHLSKDNKLMALKFFYVSQIFYKLTINLTKSSILLLYLRIFVQRWFRICCYLLLGIVLVYMVATTASSIWQCSPVEGAWDKSTRAKCISLTRNWYANAGYSIATDIMILCLPMQPIRASKLPAIQKKALMLVFALGGFVTITSIMRATTLDFSTTSRDITYDIASTLWTMIEQNVAIICACLPMCCMILTWLLPKAFAAAAAPNPDSDEPVQTIGQMRTCHVRGPSSDWKMTTNDTRDDSVNRSQARYGDDTSEEYILTNVGEAAQGPHIPARANSLHAFSYEQNPYNKPQAP